MESPKQSNKISDIVKLKRMLKKWRLQASTTTTTTATTKKPSLSQTNSTTKGIKFLKRTLSFTDTSSTNPVSPSSIPKGFLAVDVGEEMKRFVIPTNYLKHQAFCLLLKDAEEEFGFQQEGVLRIPCDVEMFENVLRVVEVKSNAGSKQAFKYSRIDGSVCGSAESCKSRCPTTPLCR